MYKIRDEKNASFAVSRKSICNHLEAFSTLANYTGGAKKKIKEKRRKNTRKKRCVRYVFRLYNKNRGKITERKTNFL